MPCHFQNCFYFHCKLVFIGTTLMFTGTTLMLMVTWCIFVFTRTTLMFTGTIPMFTRTTLMFTGTTWSLLELFWCLLDIHSSSKYSSIEYSSIDSLPFQYRPVYKSCHKLNQTSLIWGLVFTSCLEKIKTFCARSLNFSKIP